MAAYGGMLARYPQESQYDWSRPKLSGPQAPGRLDLGASAPAVHRISVCREAWSLQRPAKLSGQAQIMPMHMKIKLNLASLLESSRISVSLNIPIRK